MPRFSDSLSLGGDGSYANGGGNIVYLLAFILRRWIYGISGGREISWISSQCLRHLKAVPDASDLFSEIFKSFTARMLYAH
jgi:hypothetical protein